MRLPFDPRKVGGPETGEAGRGKVLTVSELTHRIKDSLEIAFPSVWVTGEVSNLSRPMSGHVYFTLKDAEAQLQAVMFRQSARKVRFEFSDGQKVNVLGRITVYEARGQYQVSVFEIEPVGIGPLQLAFRQLCDKLAKEGLFDPEHKKPLPFLPRKIAVVTSPTGAAIRDIMTVLDRRFPKYHLVLYPVKVQGEGAAEEIASAIRHLNKLGGFDVMIVGRGGGSLEDLWAFNEEVVARAIYDSAIPIVSAVGHEIDVTVSDLVADRRALTPTEAAEIVLPRLDQVEEQLRDGLVQLHTRMRARLARDRERLSLIGRLLAGRHPRSMIQQGQQRVDDLLARLVRAAGQQIELSRHRLQSLWHRLEGNSPLRILSRGYSVTTDAETGRVVASLKQVSEGMEIATRFSDGTARSRVTSLKGLAHKEDAGDEEGKRAETDAADCP